MENTDNEKTLNVRRSAEICTECTAEYILPDYKGDVKRILHTEARVLPSGSFDNGGGTELGGVTVFNVLYLDFENKLSSVEFTGDYSVNVQTKDVAEEIFAEFGAENVSIRLPGPRKMNAKCTVRTVAKGQGRVSCAAVGSTFEPEQDPQTCMCQIRTAQIMRGTLGDREYAEEFFFAAGASLDEVEVIAKRADVKVSSVVMKENEATVGGVISVFAVIGIGDAKPCAKEMKIPFEEKVEVRGASSDAEGVASCRISSLECSMNPTDDGVRVNVSVINDIEATAYINTDEDIVCDVYSTVSEVENQYEKIRYEEFCGARETVAKAVKDIPKSETDAAHAADVVYMSTDAKVLDATVAGSCVNIDGEVRFSGVACEINDDGTPTYLPVKFFIPFSENVNFNSQIPSGAVAECTVCSSDARITLDESNFYAECAVTLSVGVFAEKEMTRVAVSDVTAEATDVRDSHTVSVYFPDTGDTLFEVAKRFKTPPMKIAEDNSLTAEAVKAQNAPFSLADVGKLIIKNM